MRGARLLPTLALLLVLGACDKPMTPAEQKAIDDRAVAQVEATERALPPLRPVSLQPLPAKFTAHHAGVGRACAFVPKGKTAPIALTRGPRAEMLIDGLPAVFAADTGSAKLPLGAWSHYVGKALALGLAQPGAGSPIARLVISDPYNRPVFTVDGMLRCPAR